jgi:hypothetical protein
MEIDKVPNTARNAGGASSASNPTETDINHQKLSMFPGRTRPPVSVRKRQAASPLIQSKRDKKPRQ